MPQIFINYRRSDATAHAGRLSDSLKRKFDDDSVFLDMADDGIGAGREFSKVLTSEVSNCDVLLVVIGPTWESCVGDTGQRRLEEADDWVRKEIAAALERKVLVIPVRVGGAKLPAAAKLPDSIKALVQRQAFELRDDRWESDIAELSRQLQRVSAWKRNVWLAAAALTLVVVGIAVLGMCAPEESPPTSDASHEAAPDAKPSTVAPAPIPEACKIPDGALTLFDFTGGQPRAWNALQGSVVVGPAQGCLDQGALQLEVLQDSSDEGVGAAITLNADQRHWQDREVLHLTVQLADSTPEFDDLEVYVELQSGNRTCECSWMGRQYLTQIPRARWYDLQLPLEACERDNGRPCPFDQLDVDSLGINFSGPTGKVALLVDSIWVK
jgi:hypothetical protein